MNAALAICDHCEGKRQVWNQWAGGFIRCVKCTQPPRNPDRSAFDQINAAEAGRREQRAINDAEPVRYTGLDWTIAMLALWGRMVRDRGIGYPPMSTTEKARIGRGGGADPLIPLPPDIEAIDNAVSAAPIELKILLIEHYTKDGYAVEKAARLGISRSLYFVRKSQAERHIANEIGA